MVVGGLAEVAGPGEDNVEEEGEEEEEQEEVTVSSFRFQCLLPPAC